MPPIRTSPPGNVGKTQRSKSERGKTDRSSSENQERAYVAASRRTDRTLEARVESARRASEVHRRRTGRSLRVSQEDVLNEEMYEEEVELPDLPYQFQTLPPHLQTGSADFDRRLAAYMTGQMVSMGGLPQVMNESYFSRYHESPEVRPHTFHSPTPPQEYHPNALPNSAHQVSSPSRDRADISEIHSRALSATAWRASSYQSNSGLSDNFTAHHQMSKVLPIQHTFVTQHTSSSGFDPYHSRIRQGHSTPFAYSFSPPPDQVLSPFPIQSPEPQHPSRPPSQSHTGFQTMLMEASSDPLSNRYYPWTENYQDVSRASATPSHYGGMSATLPPSALSPHWEAASHATKPGTAAPVALNNPTVTHQRLRLNLSDK